MRLLRVLREPRYLAIAVVSSLAMVGIYIYTQVLGIVENIGLWFEVIPAHNAALFGVFAALFGATLAFQINAWRQPKVCSASGGGKKGMAGAHSGATFAVFLVAQCPACASLGALFLPISALAVFTNFGWAITLAGIGMLLFTLRYLGGFKK